MSTKKKGSPKGTSSSTKSSSSARNVTAGKGGAVDMISGKDGANSTDSLSVSGNSFVTTDPNKTSTEEESNKTSKGTLPTDVDNDALVRAILKLDCAEATARLTDLRGNNNVEAMSPAERKKLLQAINDLKLAEQQLAAHELELASVHSHSSSSMQGNNVNLYKIYQKAASKIKNFGGNTATDFERRAERIKTEMQLVEMNDLSVNQLVQPLLHLFQSTETDIILGEMRRENSQIKDFDSFIQFIRFRFHAEHKLMAAVKFYQKAANKIQSLNQSSAQVEGNFNDFLKACQHLENTCVEFKTTPMHAVLVTAFFETNANGSTQHQTAIFKIFEGMTVSCEGSVPDVNELMKSSKAEIFRLEVAQASTKKSNTNLGREKTDKQKSERSQKSGDGTVNGSSTKAPTEKDTEKAKENKSKACFSMVNRGECKFGKDCYFSHDDDLVREKREKEKSRKPNPDKKKNTLRKD